MHILIIDDEPLARSRLRHLLGDCTPHGEHWTMSEAASASQALPLLSGPLPVDIVLLDIQMPGANGMSFAFTLQQLPAPPAIIFVTAHSHYAAQAFDVQACDYLTKPVRLERLQQALAKAKNSAPPATLARSWPLPPAARAGLGRRWCISRPSSKCSPSTPRRAAMCWKAAWSIWSSVTPNTCCAFTAVAWSIRPFCNAWNLQSPGAGISVCTVLPNPCQSHGGRWR